MWEVDVGGGGVADDRMTPTRARITRPVRLRSYRPDLLQSALVVSPDARGTIIRRHECGCTSIQLDVGEGRDVGGRTFVFLPGEWTPDELEQPDDSSVMVAPSRKKVERVRGFQI
jgi:hypothetical protein